MAGLSGLFGGPSRKLVEKITEGKHEIRTKPSESLYILNCSDCELSVTCKTIKVSAENCRNVKLRLSSSPLSSFLEIVNSDKLDVYLGDGVSINTTTIDGSDNITIHVTKAKEQIEKIWWHKVSKVHVDRGEAGLFLLDKIEVNNKITMFQHVCKPKDDGTFSIEPVMRPPITCQLFRENGYPITEEEKIRADQTKAEYDRKMIEMILKDVHIPQAKKE